MESNSRKVTTKPIKRSSTIVAHIKMIVLFLLVSTIHMMYISSIRKISTFPSESKRKLKVAPPTAETGINVSIIKRSSHNKE